MTPDISIIIPAFNEEKFIRETLASVFASKFSGSYEVIVVCNGCTDDTAKIAKDSGAKVLLSPIKGAPAAANYGASKAKGRTLAFLDADTTVSANLLEEVNHAVKNGYAGGRTVVRWPGRGVAARLFSLVSYVHRHKWGGFCFVNKDVFREVGGYKLGVYGFDFDLAQRVSKGRKVALLRKSSVLTSDRRFAHEGWWKHMWLALKRNLVDEKLKKKGVKDAHEVDYKDHR